jgi:hypothetical protein
MTYPPLETYPHIINKVINQNQAFTNMNKSQRF